MTHTSQVHHMHTEHRRPAHISLLCPWAQCTGQKLRYYTFTIFSQCVTTDFYTSVQYCAYIFLSHDNLFLNNVQLHFGLDKWQSFFMGEQPFCYLANKKHRPHSLAWPHPFFINHHAADQRGILPLGRFSDAGTWYLCNLSPKVIF